jgi:hypothetical protein
MIARVRIPNKQKFGLFVVPSLSVFIIGVAAARVIVTDTQGVHPEISWLALWSAVESSVAVIVCCLVSFKALFKGQHASAGSQLYHAQGYGNACSQGRTIALTHIEAEDDVAVRDRPREIDASSEMGILKDAAGMGSHKRDGSYEPNVVVAERSVSLDLEYDF